MDTTAVAVTAGSGWAIAIVMQAIKALLENWLKPENPMHDPFLQAIAALVGVVGFLAHAASVSHLTGPIAWDAAAQGAFAGAAAITVFHVLTGKPPYTNPLVPNQPQVTTTTTTPGPPLYTNVMPTWVEPSGSSSISTPRGLAARFEPTMAPAPATPNPPQTSAPVPGIETYGTPAPVPPAT